MEVRELTRDDFDAWAAMRHELWPHCAPEGSRGDLEQILSSPDEVCFLLVDGDGRPVGLIEGAVHPGPETPHAHVEAWYVAPDLRRKGYGRDLLDRFENWCLHRGICRMTSDTNEKYPISPHAHEGCGFRVLMRQTIFIRELPERSQ